jgi:hypothetical protein
MLYWNLSLRDFENPVAKMSSVVAVQTGAMAGESWHACHSLALGDLTADRPCDAGTVDRKRLRLGIFISRPIPGATGGSLDPGRHLALFHQRRV